MKYLITESKVEQFVFRYLNLRKLIQIKRGDHIYFVNSEGDEFAQLRYDEDTEWVGISGDFYNDIANFFNLERNDLETIIAKWIQQTFSVHKKPIVQQFLHTDIPLFKVPY